MKKPTNDLNGWLVVDKPLEMGSTPVVSKLKWLLRPGRIGHGGTLDPLASGVLPIALGKATRLIPYVMDGKKTYLFDVTWGSSTTTDDEDGELICQSDKRPTAEEIQAVLPRFSGQIQQRPPAYSALKINGQRAYDLSRRGIVPDLKSRSVTIYSLKLLWAQSEKARFEVICSKGTYVRSLARDFGETLGCFGHVSFLRRTLCGPFSESQAISLAKISEMSYNDLASNILPLETALDDILVLALDEKDVQRLVLGQAVPIPSELLSGSSRSISEETVFRVMLGNRLAALVRCQTGFLKPFRVFLNKQIMKE